ncbi:unnamed protein product [Plutella xylostella]|uniref:(diamondback moth) hypothetical protein n=1 Tax=Plutella xylostella TaxID=51655 RepID=A0A8S4G3B7_PLUXY|nr:unnamed protein product [Plutella xylostella]
MLSHSSRVDIVDDIVGRAAVDGAADGLAGSQHLLDCAGQLAGHGARPHHLGDADHLLHGDVTVVLD